MSVPQDVPVLFLVFNRPDLAGRVLKRIRKARPSRLFIAADGPRANRPDDISACLETRNLVKKVDWPCEVITLFRENNLGCREAVESALTWFFDQVEYGIILEDDCLPDISFFPFCAELLDRYKDDEKVMAISGDSYKTADLNPVSSYSFSIYHHVWGWATWRRAWRYYNSKLDDNSPLFDKAWLADLLKSEPAAEYWSQTVANYHAGLINSWALPWNFSCWLHGGICVAPSVNMVNNIGFDNRATHTKKSLSSETIFPSKAMRFPLRHPADFQRDMAAERASEITFFPPRRKPGLERGFMSKWKTSVMEKLSRFFRSMTALVSR